MRNWYGLEVRTKHERIVANALMLRELETFLPVYKALRIWKDRKHEVEEPLFPGYLFCRFDAFDRLPVLMTPGVVSIVSYGKIPAPVDDDDIAGVQAVVRSRLKVQPWPYLRAGDHVRIVRGPLAGLNGVLVYAKSAWRFVVSINLIHRSVAAEVDASMLGAPSELSLHDNDQLGN